MTAPALFEIVPFTGSVSALPEPDNGPYIVAAKDGYFVHRAFHFGRVLVPTTQAPASPQPTPTLFYNLDPKLPASLIAQAHSFFRAIYEAKRAEAMVDITWSEEKGYRLFVPPQQAHGAGVKCVRKLEHYAGQMVGTIHSHCDFSAFHSGTDKHDADGQDGLHITIGDVMKPEYSMAIMISVAGTHWDMTLDEIVEGEVVPVQHPKWWERYVNDPVKPSWQLGPMPVPTPPKPKTITAPTKNNPVVVGIPSEGAWPMVTSYSLDSLLWRYGDAFTASEQESINAIQDLLDNAQATLAALGIDMDTEFSPNLAEEPRQTQFPFDLSDEDIPEEWRLPR